MATAAQQRAFQSKFWPYCLTVSSASSSHHTLWVMTVVALIFTPIVLVYQGWTYWVFRARLRVPPLAFEHGPTTIGDPCAGDGQEAAPERFGCFHHTDHREIVDGLKQLNQTAHFGRPYLASHSP